jgi:hypothetical protein
MFKNKLAVIIGILIAVIIGETIYFGFKLNQEKAKTAFLLQENFSKDEDNNASIQVKIKEDTPEGQYNDSLYYTAEQWASKTPADIEADKKARVDKWLSIVRNPAPALEPTKEELQAQADELKKQADELNARIEK